MTTWLITGASWGLGREWTEAALERGDRVVAAARFIAALGGLVQQYGDAVLPLELDVTDRTAVRAAVPRLPGTWARSTSWSTAPGTGTSAWSRS